ncbi:hypothetical protein FACS1894132_04240 [Clostridia bacterium]|nr:hypothetical protein FACS1894132_04240 [Clostridia bacterium]
MNNRPMANGNRKPPTTILTEEQINELHKDIKSINADISKFVFNDIDASGTSYDDINDSISVKGNVLPDLESGSVHPRDLMSSRAVLAHEYYGHRANKVIYLPPSSWEDEYRASIDAAKNTPNLSDEDRKYLVLDAFERKEKAGIPLNEEDIKLRKKYVYGYDN